MLIFSNITIPTPLKVIFFLLACIGTATSFFFIERYQNVGQQLLLNASFSEGLLHWKPHKPSSGNIVIQNNHLILSNYFTEESVRVSQKIKTSLNEKKFRLSATLASKNLISGKRDWNKARLILVQYIAGEAQWGLRHSLAALAGSQDWQIYCENFIISPKCSEIQVIAEMNHCSGELRVKDLTLYEVEETTIYTCIKWLIRTTWILFVLVIFAPRVKGGRSTIISFFTILTVVGIVIGTTLPGKVKSDLVEDITTDVSTYAAPATKAIKEMVNRAKYKFPPLDITKIAHFSLFALLAILLLLKIPCRPIRLVLLDLFMLACASELLQFYVDDRSPLLTDVLIDMAGGLSGLLAGVQALRSQEDKEQKCLSRRK